MADPPSLSTAPSVEMAAGTLRRQLAGSNRLFERGHLLGRVVQHIVQTAVDLLQLLHPTKRRALVRLRDRRASIKLALEVSILHLRQFKRAGNGRDRAIRI